MAPKKGAAAAGPQFPPADMMLDLCTRFILNCPEEEWQSSERIMFHVEEAHWFYEDFCRESPEGRNFRGFSLRDFAAVMFSQHPSLAQHKDNADHIVKCFIEYKHTVPVFGAILLNPALDKCIMVKGWKSNSWGFPKGKVNKGEPGAECAAREVFEELGYDVTPHLVDGDFVEVKTEKQCTRLYIIPGISEQTGFAPQARKEISEYAWHWVSDLPIRGSATPGHAKYYMVHPFVKRLRQWIAHRLKGGSAAGPLSFSASADVEVVLDVPVAAEQPKVQDKKAKGRPQPSASAVKTAAHPMLDFKLDVAAVMKAYHAKS